MPMSTIVYPLLCGLSLAVLPFQPEEEVLTMAGDLPAMSADEAAEALTAEAAEIERVGRLSIKQPHRVLA